jgi:predicted nucleic acid-binding protein
MAGQRGRRRRLHDVTIVATVDTGWVIAAEQNVTAARRLVAAFAQLGRMLVVPPVVVVEARQRAASLGAVDDILAQLEGEPHTPMDGRRASDLLREAGRHAAGQGIDASARIHAIGTADALVAAMAERLGGLVYTADPQHMEWLRDAGARITIQPVPDFTKASSDRRRGRR